MEWRSSTGLTARQGMRPQKQSSRELVSRRVRTAGSTATTTTTTTSATTSTYCSLERAQNWTATLMQETISIGPRARLGFTKQFGQVKLERWQAVRVQEVRAVLAAASGAIGERTISVVDVRPEV